MKIPESVKVGGKHYEIVYTNNLDSGIINANAEIDFRKLEIRISNSARSKMESDFIHELLHAVYDHLGYKEHDEKNVDELANALYMVIQDNPKMFQE